MNFINKKPNKQKVLNFVLILGWSFRAKNSPKLFFKVLERQNMQNQTIFELCTDDNKSEYSSNPKDILRSAKKNMKNSKSTQAATLGVL